MSNILIYLKFIIIVTFIKEIFKKLDKVSKIDIQYKQRIILLYFLHSICQPLGFSFDKNKHVVFLLNKSIIEVNIGKNNSSQQH